VNPYAPIVPCHRVVTFQGKKGGFSGHTSGMSVFKLLFYIYIYTLCYIEILH
jgi:O6-methylguanine-DNA--protein-cysteine methyltransferase